MDFDSSILEEYGEYIYICGLLYEVYDCFSAVGARWGGSYWSRLRSIY